MSERILSMDTLKGKVVLITGAASGIGAEAARLLAAHGAKIAAADLDGPGARRTAEETGGHAIAMDVTSEADWARAVAETVSTLGSLDVLVNCAGIELLKSISDTSFADWRRVMSVNLDGVFLGTRAAIAAMGKRGGSIVNISSVAGINGYSRQAAYCASKGGVRLLSKASAVECAEAGLGIRVNSIHPGIIDTPMTQGILGCIDSKARSEVQARWTQMHPLGRLGS
ncbi:MAG: SDR family NAD(P)-dependent oxidoreductase, partial [Proteobacteria bacterium]|nr:SDR family NAD(P)-dependent oxidoreductase [Pseudomonadota bacterium]